jgi:hypothetical protein
MLQLPNPTTNTMWIRGSGVDGISWDQGRQAQYVGSNVWQLDLPFTGRSLGNVVELKALLNDDMWMNGANAWTRLPMQSLVQSDSDTDTTQFYQIQLYPSFFKRSGSYHYIRNIFSPQLGNKRDLVIYTPPSYAENTLKIYSNVLLMHDGQNLFNQSTSFGGISWQCQNTVDELIAEGRMDELVIVGSCCETYLCSSVAASLCPSQNID